MRDRGADLLLGLVLGAALGATLALLFAPQEGAETRQYLIDQGFALRKRAQETVDEFGDQFDEFGDQIKERSQKAVGLATKPFARRKRGLARLRPW